MARQISGVDRRGLLKQLGAIDFGDRIILFGAALLLSVLPMVILLSALGSKRIDDDIAQHLGASMQGSKIIEGLFRTTAASFELSVLIGLLLALAGILATARSVQVIYERTFDHPPNRGWRNVLRCFVWIAGVAGIFIADAAIARTLRNGPAGPVTFGLANLAYLTLFFWWSLHFLLEGREPWRRLWRAALATALMWIGLGVFASFYFSSTIVSDSKMYGTIGVVFTLVTWFIAMAAVLTLGTLVGSAAPTLVDWVPQSHEWRRAVAEPAQRMGVRYFITSDDVERSARFSTEVLGGTAVFGPVPTNVALANSVIVINAGGGPTDDKPTVTLETPPDPDRISSFLNIRVPDIQAVYEEWSAKGAQFLTPPKQHAYETRCYIRDPDGYIIEVGQTTDP